MLYYVVLAISYDSELPGLEVLLRPLRGLARGPHRGVLEPHCVVYLLLACLLSVCVF